LKLKIVGRSIDLNDDGDFIPGYGVFTVVPNGEKDQWFADFKNFEDAELFIDLYKWIRSKEAK
jgi:hypothetical protein